MGTARYLDPLEVERIELHAFGSSAMVTSFRTAKLEGWVVDELSQMAADEEQASLQVQDNTAGGDPDLIMAHTIGEKGHEEDILARRPTSGACRTTYAFKLPVPHRQHADEPTL